MTDSAAHNQAGGGVQIPDDIRAKYPDLITLILGSESMNNEERQYWVNILPIMTPDQVQNLRDILENEKKQLEAIDKKYAAKTAPVMEQKQSIAETEMQRQARRSELQEEEEAHEAEEEKETEDLLNRIENL